MGMTMIMYNKNTLNRALHVKVLIVIVEALWASGVG
jgi:hypothetical protein